MQNNYLTIKTNNGLYPPSMNVEDNIKPSPNKKNKNIHKLKVMVTIDMEKRNKY